MCTLIVLHRCVAGRPLVVAANRDEFFDRPAEDIAIRTSQTGPILSPLDLEAGGTWVGLSQRGVFAGLTNLRPAQETAPHDTHETRVEQGAATKLKSRGGVVMTALESKSAADAIATLMDLEEGAYNPFQLLVADGRDAWLLVYRERPRALELAPGAHVVGNVEDEAIVAALGLDAESKGDQSSGADRGATNTASGEAKVASAPGEWLPGFEGVAGLANHEEPRTIKLTRIKRRVEKLLTDPGLDLFEGLAGVCREHIDEHIGEPSDRAERPIEPTSGETKDTNVRGENESTPASEGTPSPFEATCVHIANRYGTRSSLLLELADHPEASRLWTTNGPPCERPFENRSSLLGELGVGLQAGHALS